jgi:hypothetical protein
MNSSTQKQKGGTKKMRKTLGGRRNSMKGGKCNCGNVASVFYGGNPNLTPYPLNDFANDPARLVESARIIRTMNGGKTRGKKRKTRGKKTKMKPHKHLCKYCKRNFKMSGGSISYSAFSPLSLPGTISPDKIVGGEFGSLSSYGNVPANDIVA